MTKELKRFLVYDRENQCGCIVRAKTKEALRKVLKKDVKIIGEIK